MWPHQQTFPAPAGYSRREPPWSRARTGVFIVSLVAMFGSLASTFFGATVLRQLRDLDELPCGSLTTPSAGRALYQGQVAGPADRRTPLGNKASGFIATVEKTTGSGKNASTRRCETRMLDALTVGPDDLPLDATMDVETGGARTHGTPADASALRAECRELLATGGTYSETIIADRAWVHFPACWNGSRLEACGGKKVVLSTMPLAEHRQRLLRTARISLSLGPLAVFIAFAIAMQALRGSTFVLRNLRPRGVKWMTGQLRGAPVTPVQSGRQGLVGAIAMYRHHGSFGFKRGWHAEQSWPLRANLTFHNDTGTYPLAIDDALVFTDDVSSSGADRMSVESVLCDGDVVTIATRDEPAARQPAGPFRGGGDQRALRARVIVAGDAEQAARTLRGKVALRAVVLVALALVATVVAAANVHLAVAHDSSKNERCKP